MKSLMALMISIFWIVPSYAFNADEQVEKAMKEFVEEDSESGAIRRLQVVTENEPGHYQARWLYVYYVNFYDRGGEVDSNVLRDLYPEVVHIVDLAKQAGDDAYAHYVYSRYSEEHRAYQHALDEIDKALELEPKSVLYNWAKARLLVVMGGWYKNNDMIYLGIEHYRRAHQLAGDKHPVYFSEVDYHFQTAWSLGRLSGGESCPQEAIDHYLAVTRLSKKKDKTLAYAWSNMSCAYRKAGQCDKAKEASENALKVMKFGAAKVNLQYSEFCVQMQKIGLWQSIDDS